MFQFLSDFLTRKNILVHHNFRYLMLLSGREPLSWATRVQIALDSARGLEYIHEHTVPVYIHRDIKPANILIDINFRAKVVIIFSDWRRIHALIFFLQ